MAGAQLPAVSTDCRAFRDRRPHWLEELGVGVGGTHSGAGSRHRVLQSRAPQCALARIEFSGAEHPLRAPDCKVRTSGRPQGTLPPTPARSPSLSGLWSPHFQLCSRPVPSVTCTPESITSAVTRHWKIHGPGSPHLPGCGPSLTPAPLAGCARRTPGLKRHTWCSCPLEPWLSPPHCPGPGRVP